MAGKVATRSPEESISEAQIREELASWDHRQLVDFALQLAWQSPETRRKLEKSLDMRRDMKSVAPRLRKDIDHVLRVGLVRWQEVAPFMGRLEEVLHDVQTLGRRQSSIALDLVYYYIEHLPRVFGCVEEENELADFLVDLTTSALELCTATGSSRVVLLEHLIRVATKDDNDRTHDAIELVANAQLTPEERPEVATRLEEAAAQVTGYTRDERIKLAEKVRRGQKRSKPTPPIADSGPTQRFQFTHKQGQYLAFIAGYCRMHRVAPSEPDMVNYFRVTPPAVHQMVVTLDRLGLIQRVPGQARSIKVLVPIDQLPRLR